MWHTGALLSLDQRQGWFLYRNYYGSDMTLPGIKEVCRPCASGSKRLNRGAILAKFLGRETLGAVNCPMYIKISGFNWPFGMRRALCQTFSEDETGIYD